MNENKEVRPLLIQALEKNWDIKTDHYFAGEKNRPDLLIKHKLHNNIYFLVELKADGRKRGNDFVSHINQCVRYSKIKVNTKLGYVNIPVILFPAISDNFYQVHDCDTIIHNCMTYFKPVHSSLHLHNNVNSLLSIFKLSEIKTQDEQFNKKFIGFKHLHIIHNNITIWRQYDDRINIDSKLFNSLNNANLPY
jgi:hypothetical protein